jgi:hypothetical protein
VDRTSTQIPVEIPMTFAWHFAVHQAMPLWPSHTAQTVVAGAPRDNSNSEEDSAMDTTEKTALPDSEIEWYDFGGGFKVAPTTDVEGNTLPGIQSDAPNMAALHCIRNGKYHYKVIEGTFTTEDLPSMLKELAPVFEAEVAKAQQ